MPKPLVLTLPHRHSEAEIKSRIDSAIDDVRRKFPGQVSALNATWASPTHLDFSLAALGQSVTGRIDVQPQSLRLEIDLPFPFSLLAEKLEPQIRKEAQKLLT